MYKEKLKKPFDVLSATVIIILLLPLFVILSLLVFLWLGMPIIFKQQRAGIQGRPFFIYKFRTMRNQYDEQENLLSDADRLTKFGKFLRLTSLDELPEFFNVLKGDMSIVGPRPYLQDYVAIYTPGQARRLEVLPGITGWQQVNGRNKMAWEEKFVYDIWYIDHISFLLDLKIIFLTIIVLFKIREVNEKGCRTSSRFQKSN